ncbi:hypothetical protein [Pseudomonas abieticivorans]|uniref:hypothetical protein n=1 Tax=Pseudomonas abieticivorans TaxID=2931382 RepID=UPI0020C15E66|nr:hypothetical protein [Pseudomonas sp. PIA16]
MRWLFLLLLVLNGFYFVWHQQEAPLRAKEIAPLSLYKGSHQDIRLLSESKGEASRDAAPADQQETCLYLGGFAKPDSLVALQQRLASLDIASQAQVIKGADGARHWLQIAPQSQRLLDDTLVDSLSHDFNDLKHEIMRCEGVATGE